MGPVSIAAVGWFMGSLINKVVMELLEAWAKRLDLGDEFETLKDQLLQLDALLTSARGIRTNNRFLDELAQNLQKLAYQAENLLDELDYYRLQDQIRQKGTQEQENCSYRSLVPSSSSGQLLASHSIFSTFERLYNHSAPYAPVPLPKTSPSKINLSRRMNELAGQLQKSEEKLRKALQTESLVNIARNTEICQTEATNLPQTSPFHTENRKVVGRNKERDQLLNLLKNEESATVGKVLVVAIVGCGGVGKTTLAGLVFNDPNIKRIFDVRSWICVSTRFNIVRFTCEILEGACGGISFDKPTNVEVLERKLKDELVSKRFLLVLDDMWEDKDKSQWDEMIALLNNCMLKRGVILVTTRNQSVANMVDARDNIYLEGLDDNAFLSFFSTCIFNDSNFRGNWRLRNIGQQIAKQLKGNPLAAKTVGALLKEKHDERYWMEIRDNEEWKLQSDPNDIMPALRLSYEHMPFHLQRCFSYCAIFPEDHAFTSKELVYLWMAQGFIDERSKGKRMEDIGRIYFNDLFNRGFFQTKQTNYGSAYCTFHDLIHDLACMVSDKECLSINGTEPRQIPPTIRHLSIFNNTERGEETIVRALEFLKGENLSTIINWDKLSSGTFKSISHLLKETKFLRSVTLNLCSEVQKYFHFQNFVSLRYLKLIVPINSTWTFPKELCSLYHLEVFEIKGGNIVELPNNFSNLVSLRHFIASGTLHSKIWGVGKLTSLQGLTNFDVQQKEGFEIEQLGSLKEIRGSLRIRNLENVKSKEEASKARLAEKEKLDTLYLQWNHGAQENESVLEGLKPSTKLRSLEIFRYGGVASPTWLEPSLIFLESLTLMFCTAWELLPPIGELEFLKYLELGNLATREIGPQCYGTQQSMKFPSLEYLCIIGMPNLEKWVWSDHLQQFLCFKKLKKLTIQDCPKLRDLPLSRCATSEVLERFPSLQSLIIQDCPLIFQLSPLPYSSRLHSITIDNSGIIESMRYNKEEEQMLISLSLSQSSSFKVDELLAFHELSSLHFLKLSNISNLESFLELISSLHVLELSNIYNLESLDLHSLVDLETLVIEGCQSLASLTFGQHLVQLMSLKIISCETLRSIKGLKYWVNLKLLHIRKCPGFIAAWDSASKEIEKTEPDFSLSLIDSDSLALLTLPICKQLTSLQFFELEFSNFTKEDEISPQLLTSSINLVDISGCKNLQSFPFHLFPSLKELRIKFPQIRRLPTSSHDEITRECLKLRNIKIVNIFMYPVKIHFELRLEEMICQHMDADN